MTTVAEVTLIVIAVCVLFLTVLAAVGLAYILKIFSNLKRISEKTRREGEMILSTITRFVFRFIRKRF